MPYLDWTEVIDNEFGDERDLQRLVERKFFGKLEINWQYGIPISINAKKSYLSKSEKERRRRAKQDTGSFGSDGITYSPLPPDVGTSTISAE